MSYNDTLRTKVQGHLRIWEKETGKVLLDQHNDINPENFSYAIATSLIGQSSVGNIKYMVFGDGGARATSSNKYIYSVPQTVGRAATLYNKTYERNMTKTDDDNYMEVTHSSGNDYTDIIVHTTIKKDDVITTLGSDGTNGSIITEATFSEIGLETARNDLITHICFFPIQKTSSSSLIIDYLIRIQII